ncbi:MAG: hypothetical protein JWR07_5588 [Nevskia sp.]|nr:hypothetical protein [Nevskia sp.]
MKDSNRIEASLAAAQDDVSKIFQGYDVPEEYRTRLTAYIQRWYLDQGACGGQVCALHTDAQAGIAAAA